jgi:hypothetical protein
MTGGEKLARRLVFGSLLGGPLVTMSACGSDFTCEDRKTCSPPEGLAGSSSGQAGAAGSASGQHGGTAGSGSGKGGSAGSGAIGGDSGGESDGGTGGGDAGASTTGGSSSAGASDGGRGGSGGRDAGGDGGNGDAGSADPGAFCGNGRIEEDEACDDGEDNGLGLERCAPDCSRVIRIKHIVIGDPMENEYLQPDPIAKVDATCPSGYKALFSYGTDRRATTVPFKIVNPIDWALQPYTYYVNEYENLVWITRDVALLGVEDGAFVGLENPISNTTYAFVANINVDGTSLTGQNCNGWSSVNTGGTKLIGLGLMTDEGYLALQELECGYQVLVYCIEQ